MPQLPSGVTETRAARLRAKGAEVQAARLAGLVGSTQEILVEKGNKGRTPCFTQVQLTNAAPRGALARVRVTGVQPGHLLAQVAA